MESGEVKTSQEAEMAAGKALFRWAMAVFFASLASAASLIFTSLKVPWLGAIRPCRQRIYLRVRMSEEQFLAFHWRTLIGRYTFRG